jgi:hypothetical protein
MVFLLTVLSDQRPGELAASTDKRARGFAPQTTPGPLFGLPRHNPAGRKKSRDVQFFFKVGLRFPFWQLLASLQRKTAENPFESSAVPLNLFNPVVV